MLEIIQTPMLIDNYGYLLHDPVSGDTAVVDPSEATTILSELNKRNWRLKYILNTHHHFDHVGGNEELIEKTGAQVVCSRTDMGRIEGATYEVSEGDSFSIGESTAKVMEIPGHTIGHIAFYFPDDQAVFCGDTLFSLGCGRLFEGSPSQMWNSLRRLADLPRDTKVYCGHEYTLDNAKFALSIDPQNAALQNYCHRVNDLRNEGRPTIPSTIGIEVETNPFMRAPQLLSNLGLPDNTEAPQAFSALRQAKDKF